MKQAIDRRVEESAGRLGEALLLVAGRDLVAMHIHGSAVLGDFIPGFSDLDVLVVVQDDIEQPVVARIAETLAAHDPTPATSIEASVVTRSAALNPRAPWPFVVHVTNHPNDSKVVHGTDLDGDPDLVLHYAVLRRHGWTVCGTPVAGSVGEIDRATITAHLVDELTWAADNAPGSYAVLNACRALRFISEGVICSKSDGAVWALREEIEPDLVSAALAARRSGSGGPAASRSRAWVLSVARSIRSSDR